MRKRLGRARVLTMVITASVALVAIPASAWAEPTCHEFLAEERRSFVCYEIGEDAQGRPTAEISAGRLDAPYATVYFAPQGRVGDFLSVCVWESNDGRPPVCLLP